MKKKEILEATDSELFVLFYLNTVQLVKEANSTGGETKRATTQANWIIDECCKRFGLEKNIIMHGLI